MTRRETEAEAENYRYGDARVIVRRAAEGKPGDMALQNRNILLWAICVILHTLVERKDNA